jgi:hypothetical protein
MKWQHTAVSLRVSEEGLILSNEDRLMVLQYMSRTGWELVSVDEGWAYFKQRANGEA